MCNCVFLGNTVPIVTANVTNIKATLNQKIYVLLSVSDLNPDDTLVLSTVFQPATIPGTDLVQLSSKPYTYLFTWTPQSLNEVFLQYAISLSLPKFNICLICGKHFIMCFSPEFY